MSAHFAYQHMPASGIGILDDQYRPYPSGGIGAAVPAHGAQSVNPGTIDASPTLYAPTVTAGVAVIGIPTIDAAATIHTPSLALVAALDAVTMVLGISQWLQESVGVAMSAFNLLGIAQSSDFTLATEEETDSFIDGTTTATFTVGISQEATKKLAINQHNTTAVTIEQII